MSTAVGISPPWAHHEEPYLQEVTAMAKQTCVSVPRKLNTNLKTHYVFLKLSENIEWARSALGQSSCWSTGCTTNSACASGNLSTFGSWSSSWWEEHQLFVAKSWPSWLSMLGGKNLHHTRSDPQLGWAVRSFFERNCDISHLQRCCQSGDRQLFSQKLICHHNNWSQNEMWVLSRHTKHDRQQIQPSLLGLHSTSHQCLVLVTSAVLCLQESPRPIIKLKSSSQFPIHITHHGKQHHVPRSPCSSSGQILRWGFQLVQTPTTSLKSVSPPQLTRTQHRKHTALTVHQLCTRSIDPRVFCLFCSREELVTDAADPGSKHQELRRQPVVPSPVSPGMLLFCFTVRLPKYKRQHVFCMRNVFLVQMRKECFIV